MKIAIPCSTGRLSQHFGYCDTFTFITVDMEARQIVSQEEEQPPPHVPGAFPQWLSDKGVIMVFANCLGQRAIKMFQSKGIDFLTGVPIDYPENLVTTWLNDELVRGPNVCTHE